MQVIEKSDELQVTSSSEPVLPEEQDTVKEPGLSRETWEHPNHGDLTIQPLCHVCNGKITLEDFVMAKLEKEKVDAKKKEKRRHKDKHRERHSSSKSHSHSSKDKKHSRDRDKDKEKSSHRSSDKDRKHSSKSHSSSSKSKKEKSNDKERSSVSVSSREKSKETSKSAREEQDLAAQISKATAAIEAAKKSQAEPVPQPDVMIVNTESASRPGSPLDLDLPMDGSWLEGEVSSTVTIPTPEQSSWAGETKGEPSVWEGQVNMLEVAKFSVSAFQVSGTSDYLRCV